MPCRSDYMEPNAAEKRAQIAAQLLLWLTEPARSGYILNSAQVRQFQKQANTIYAQDAGQTKALCSVVRKLREAPRADNEPTMLDVVLKDNFKDPLSRRLADWIDEHDEADRRREASEQQAAKRQETDVLTRMITELPDDSRARLKAILNAL